MKASELKTIITRADKARGYIEKAEFELKEIRYHHQSEQPYFVKAYSISQSINELKAIRNRLKKLSSDAVNTLHVIERGG